MTNLKRFINDSVLFKGDKADKIMGRIFWGNMTIVILMILQFLLKYNYYLVYACS